MARRIAIYNCLFECRDENIHLQLHQLFNIDVPSAKSALKVVCSRLFYSGHIHDMHDNGGVLDEHHRHIGDKDMRETSSQQTHPEEMAQCSAQSNT